MRVVVYEGNDSMSLSSDDRMTLLETLLDKGHAVTRVATAGTVNEMHSGKLVVVGDFVKGAPAADVYTSEDVEVHFYDVKAKRSAEILPEIFNHFDVAEIAEEKPWKPWFPVIDYDRCTNCMQCLSFCLFDVYGVNDGKIEVQNQSNCKTDCPACSRVCPDVAILFPKYRGGPINGDVVSVDDVRQEKMKVDISSLLGGDIYATLRDRSAKARSRFGKERNEDRALAERKKCLAKLQKNLDIPVEVFASLPSVDQIKAKAKVAQEKAAIALKNRKGGTLE